MLKLYVESVPKYEIHRMEILQFLQSAAYECVARSYFEGNK